MESHSEILQVGTSTYWGDIVQPTIPFLGLSFFASPHRWGPLEVPAQVFLFSL